MKRENNLVRILFFFFVVSLMQVGGQNTATDVKVGIVIDLGMAYSNKTFFCINMSLYEIYSSHPKTQTRVITIVVDSGKDVVNAAAAALDLITNKKVKAIDTFQTLSRVWSGHTTYVPRGWAIPTNGKRLKTGVPTDSDFNQFLKATKDPITNSTIYSGLCIDYFEAVIQVIPYDISYDFIPVKDVDYDTLVYPVYLEIYDAVVADTTISAHRSMYVDFSLPYIPSGAGLVVPVKDLVMRRSTIFRVPLKWKLWLISLE